MAPLGETHPIAARGTVAGARTIVSTVPDGPWPLLTSSSAPRSRAEHSSRWCRCISVTLPGCDPVSSIDEFSAVSAPRAEVPCGRCGRVDLRDSVPLSCGRCTASPRRRRGDVADITPGSPDSHRRLLVAAADPFCTVDFLNEAY